MKVILLLVALSVLSGCKEAQKKVAAADLKLRQQKSEALRHLSAGTPFDNKAYNKGAAYLASLVEFAPKAKGKQVVKYFENEEIKKAFCREALLSEEEFVGLSGSCDFQSLNLCPDLLPHYPRLEKAFKKYCSSI